MRVMSRSSKTIAPQSGRSRPARRRSNDVFPAPLGPKMTSVSPSGTARETSETRRAFERLVNSNDLRDEASADVDNVDTDAGAASEVGERGVRCAMNDACRRGYGDRNGTVRSADQDAGRTRIDADDRARNDRMGTRTGVLMRV